METIPKGFNNFIRHIVYKEYKVSNLEEIISINHEGEFTFYENILGIRLRRTEQQLDEIYADLTTKIQNDNVIKGLYCNIFFVNIITKIYDVISPIFFGTAILGLIVLGIDIFKNKKFNNYKVEIFLFLIGLLLVCYLNSYLVCLWATSFYIPQQDNLYLAYTTAQTIIICVFEIIGTILLKDTIYSLKINLKYLKILKKNLIE